MAEEGYYEFEMRQGRKYERSFTWYPAWVSEAVPGNPSNWTSYSAKLTVKSKGSDILTLTSASGITLLGAVEDHIVVKFTATQTELFTFHEGSYDLKMIPPSGEPDAFTLFAGPVLMKDEGTE